MSQGDHSLTDDWVVVETPDGPKNALTVRAVLKFLEGCDPDEGVLMVAGSERTALTLGSVAGALRFKEIKATVLGDEVCRPLDPS